ncbi:unnamed protein product [Acanthosepion pharaonis]|uniref:Uncharacterized protein n=1 Tax=Acanthosepion pharaonis TaxID=158019 RepID=A0A812BK07_ACAPH|nr:unnamed protein product [Sepia pharaonis]
MFGSHHISQQIQVAFTAKTMIHQYLLIVIVLVAVTLAVPITAGLSICCIRCNDRRKAAHSASAAKLSKKNFNQQRHLIVHPHLAAAWSDAPVVRAATPNRGKKNSALSMKLQKVTDAIYQEIDDIDISDQSQFMMPDTHRNLLPSHVDSEDGWSDADIGGSRRITDLTADYIEPCPSNRDQIQSRYMEPIQKRFFFPEDKIISSRRFNRPNIAHVPDCSQWLDASPSTVDSGISDMQ